MTIEIKRPMLIGVTGYKGSGKDTFAEIIKEFMGDAPKISPMNWLTPASDKVHMHAYADALKRVCAIMYDIPIEWFYDNEKKNMVLEQYPYCKVREVLKRVGTDAVRLQFPDTWVEATSRNVKKSMERYGALVTFVTDVRYPDNETAYIKKHGGVIVRIYNPHVHLDSDHSSETGIDEIPADYVINNDMTDEFWPRSINLFKQIVTDFHQHIEETETAGS